jgi:uncharacterized protein YndB with AHSA1/START domain
MDLLSLRLQKTNHSAVKTACDAFIRPEHLSSWFTRSATADLGIDGRCSNADGDRGEFLVLDPPRHVSFTWENPQHRPGAVVSLMFSPLPSREAEVAIEHSPLASQTDCDDMHTGRSWALDALRYYLETGEAIPYEDWAGNRRGGG